MFKVKIDPRRNCINAVKKRPIMVTVTNPRTSPDRRGSTIWLVASTN